MLRVILLILPAAALFGQTPPATPEKPPPPASHKAPPEVDAALRARITRFYQLEVEGKFNQALQLVAEDTKDLFVGSSKPAYHSSAIQSIQFYDDFTKAEVMVLVTRLLPIQGFTGHPLPTKTSSRWKLENGQWYYFVDPQKDLPSTPFGRLVPPGMAMHTGPAPGAALQPPPMPTNVANAHSLVADKAGVQLKSSGESSAQVAISNPSPWSATLALSDPKVAGLTVKLDRLTVRPGEKAILSILSSGNIQIPNTPITIVVTVPQANQTIPIKVSFTN